MTSEPSESENITQHIISATGWNVIYKLKSGFTLRPIVCFEIFKENDVVTGVAPIVFEIGILVSELAGYDEDIEKEMIGYLPPGQTLAEWIAIARENGVNYEEAAKNE